MAWHCTPQATTMGTSQGVWTVSEGLGSPCAFGNTVSWEKAPLICPPLAQIKHLCFGCCVPKEARGTPVG